MMLSTTILANPFVCHFEGIDDQYVFSSHVITPPRTRIHALTYVNSVSFFFNLLVLSNEKFWMFGSLGQLLQIPN
ncbi:hypothetical protein VIGAN_06130400 [Vigna angularis var. angularis]|uniref:Uncharacterized protein n=1 Tax=Vigna angularis var. angularis TaxID=157739 RepID=A0A0S3SBF3_PHAAN|nr:hypothetical protein VIGAN_06130400 [Vigna angularis var. angularis]